MKKREIKVENTMKKLLLCLSLLMGLTNAVIIWLPFIVVTNKICTFAVN